MAKTKINFFHHLAARLYSTSTLQYIDFTVHRLLFRIGIWNRQRADYLQTMYGIQGSLQLGRHGVQPILFQIPPNQFVTGDLCLIHYHYKGVVSIKCFSFKLSWLPNLGYYPNQFDLYPIYQTIANAERNLAMDVWTPYILRFPCLWWTHRFFARTFLWWMGCLRLHQNYCLQFKLTRPIYTSRVITSDYKKILIGVMLAALWNHFLNNTKLKTS